MRLSHNLASITNKNVKFCVSLHSDIDTIHDKIVGKNEVLMHSPDNDISQDGFNTGEHWHNAKTVRAIRKQVRFESDYEKSKARVRIKQHDKKIIKNLLIKKNMLMFVMLK